MKLKKSAISSPLWKGIHQEISINLILFLKIIKCFLPEVQEFDDDGQMTHNSKLGQYKHALGLKIIKFVYI